jgi:hypothetical protein
MRASLGLPSPQAATRFREHTEAIKPTGRAPQLFVLAIVGGSVAGHAKEFIGLPQAVPGAVVARVDVCGRQLRGYSHNHSSPGAAIAGPTERFAVGADGRRRVLQLKVLVPRQRPRRDVAASAPQKTNKPWAGRLVNGRGATR